jgi:hypothetical protein
VRLAVFCGPSLPPEDRVADARVAYLPPAARHDVINAAKAHDVILLIDGVFHHDLAPSPKECYASLAHARMFGASSMGALRAVECAPYGFTPLGAIARWYLREVIDGDDEVAVLTLPEDQTALTVPMVNVRYAVWLAHRAGILTHAESYAVIESARDIFYMDRSWEDVCAQVPQRGRAAFEKLARGHGDLKRLDARFALRCAMRWLRS